MSRATLLLSGARDRAKAVEWSHKAPPGTFVTFKRNKRSVDQNSLLWVLLTEVSRQVIWHGQRLSPEDWKDVFTASLRKARVVPGIDAGSFVLLGLHTSDMTKQELSDLVELIHAFGAEHGVMFETPTTLQGEAA